MKSNFDLREIKKNQQPIATKKINIGGQVKNENVYRIPLDQLYYNDQNGRIGTWISKYESEKGSISDLPLDEYNMVIENFIVQSDKAKFKTTKDNIKQLSQLETGVVFYDGRVIDGNRRFTCLRQLARETGDQKYNYFEAVILDENITEKNIKLMELTLQHGQESKVDYNAIEKLVSIYKDIIKNKITTVNEYANSMATTVAKVQKDVELAKLMEDFLEYINAPEQFYIARELEIDGPLNEVYNIKKRLENDSDKWEMARVALYDNMLIKTNYQDSDDITRTIREFGKKVIPNDELFEEYSRAHEEISREINNKVNRVEKVTASYLRDEIREDDELNKKVSENMEDTLYIAKKSEAKRLPIEKISDANSLIEKIDLTAVSKLRDEERNEFSKELEILKEAIRKIEERFNEFN